MVVGAPALGFDTGVQAFVYVWNENDTWTRTATLVPTTPTVNNWFGQSVAIADNMVLVGAPSATVGDGDAGAAYLFEKSGGNWPQSAILTPSDGKLSDRFGWSVALDASQALVGSLTAGLANTYPGAAYLFRKPVGHWDSAVETMKFVASDGADFDRLGLSVALYDDVLVVGAPEATVTSKSSAGAAYIFSRGTAGYRAFAALVFGPTTYRMYWPLK